MKLYICVYVHEFGHDVWPIWIEGNAPIPTSAGEAKKLQDFEPEKGEWVVVEGPFDVPKPVLPT